MAQAGSRQQGRHEGGTQPTATDAPSEQDAQASEQSAGSGLTGYIVTATKLNRVSSNGSTDPVGFGKRIELDPNHPDTVRWLANRAIVLADPKQEDGEATSTVAAGNTGATEAAPNGEGTGEPSSVQDSDPNQPQGKPAVPDGPAGAHGTALPENGQGAPVS